MDRFLRSVFRCVWLFAVNKSLCRLVLFVFKDKLDYN